MIQESTLTQESIRAYFFATVNTFYAKRSQIAHVTYCFSLQHIRRR